MAIEVSRLRFSYPEQPEHSVLTIPSWSLAKGSQTFVYGPSGGGKSTLLNLLSGLLTPTEGEISLFGQRLDTMSSRQRDQFRANKIGYVFQQFNLIPYLNAVDNIRLACQFSQRKKQANINDDITDLLTSLSIPERDWHCAIRQLSIGQQQRVAIARALINKPKFLIADEPTSSLDPVNRDAFMALLMSLVAENNITLLFVSHDMSLANYFNHVEALTDINRIEEHV
ncbi:ABC transporter ATP-binding protein [Methylophaga sp. 41_12_T18]|nr:ABC transporter ATP-binding protein [Methylophaga sp. 41_12_T18]